MTETEAIRNRFQKTIIAMESVKNFYVQINDCGEYSEEVKAIFTSIEAIKTIEDFTEYFSDWIRYGKDDMARDIMINYMIKKLDVTTKEMPSI